MMAEAVSFIKAKKSFGVIIGIVILAALAAVAVMAIQVAAMNKQMEEFEAVQNQLEYSEEQVRLLKESANALTVQVNGLNAEKEDLQNQLEELLNVKEAVPVVTKAQLEQQLVSIGELATQKYFYRNATRQDGNKEWLWGWTMPFSDVSLLVIYDGTIKAGIDLAAVRFTVNESTKTITVYIPKSKILDHNIPQETINVLEVKNNLFNSISFNDYNRFISAEKEVMAQAAIEQGLLTEADENAKKIVEAFLKAIPGIDTYTLVFQ